jgi:hypothetical protein
MQSLSRLCSDSNVYHRSMRGYCYDLYWIQRVVVRPFYFSSFLAANDKKDNPRSSSENLEWSSLGILEIDCRSWK